LYIHSISIKYVATKTVFLMEVNNVETIFVNDSFAKSLLIIVMKQEGIISKIFLNIHLLKTVLFQFFTSELIRGIMTCLL